MAVCVRQKWEVYALVISRMVVDDGKWSESTSQLGCWVGERKRILVWLGGCKMGRSAIELVMPRGENRRGGTWCLQPRDESVGVEWVSDMMRNSKIRAFG